MYHVRSSEFRTSQLTKLPTRESALEATGVFGCRNAKDAKEGAAHRVCRFKATGIGHLF